VPNAASWIALAGLAVLVAYLVEWEMTRAAGYALPPPRHPALLFIQAIRKLARARQFMLALLAFWLLSGVVYWGIQRPRFMRTFRAPTHASADQLPAASVRRHSGFPFTEQPAPELLRQGWEQLRTLSGPLPGQALGAAMPRMGSLTRTIWPTYTHLLLYLAVILCMSWLVFHRPAWLGKVQGRAPSLALVFLLLPAASLWLAAWSQASRVPMPLVTLVSPLNQLAAMITGAIVLHLLVQVAQGRRHLSLTLGVRTMLHVLIPFAWFIAIVSVAPWALWTVLDAVVPFRSEAVQSVWYFLGWHLPELVALALLFVPWIILRDRAPIRQALIRNFALIRAHGLDLMVFVLRYLLIIFPLQYVHLMFSRFEAAMVPSLIGNLVGAFTALVSLVAVALLYLELERTTPRPAQAAYAARHRPVLQRLRDGLADLSQCSADEPSPYKRLP
jgi:hypothetical protein